MGSACTDDQAALFNFVMLWRLP